MAAFPPLLDVRPTWDPPSLGDLLPGATVGSAGPLQVVDTSVDTPDGRLAARRISLRHVQVDSVAEPPTWTLRLIDDRVPSNDSVLSWPGEVDDVPAEARRVLRGITGDRPLGPVAHKVVVRRSHRLSDASGALLAEVVDEIVDGDDGRHRSVRVTGAVDRRTAKLVTRVLRRSGARPADVPAPTPPVPRRPRRKETIGRYTAAVIEDGLDRLLTEDPVLRTSGEVEAVHRARVATRRLRSDLKTLRDVLDPVWDEQLRSGLRWLGERLGAVRDADVLQARLGRRASSPGADLPGIAGLQAIVADQRVAAMAELRVALDSPRYQELLGMLEEGAVAPHLRHAPPVVLEPAGAALRRSARHPASVVPEARIADALPVLVAGPWRRLRRDVSRLGSKPTDSQLHAVRIRAKELRYAAETATPVVGPRAARLAGRAKALQTVLGDHHDAVVAESWLRAAALTADAEVAFAAGVLVGVERAEQGQLRASWRADWQSLRKAPSGWLRT